MSRQLLVMVDLRSPTYNESHGFNWNVNVDFVPRAGLAKTTEGGGASDGENLVLFAVASLDGGVMVFEPLSNFWEEIQQCPTGHELGGTNR